MEIKEHIELEFDFDDLFVKDSNLVDFERKFSGLRSLTQKMRSHLPNGYLFYLVDFVVQGCLPGDKTCRDIRWHFDGDFHKENKYVLWVKGPNRTQFAPKVQLDPPEGREQQNEYLEKTLADIEPITAPDSTIIAYDSQTPHRGVRCEEFGKRFFVRMMASNYIRPKRIKENHASV